MRYYTFRDRFEDIMTAIYDGWAWALENGHENVGFLKEPILEPRLFDEYVHVDADYEKVRKVVRSIQGSISREAYICVYYAALSVEEDSIQAIYDFLRVGFAKGSEVTRMLTIPAVERIMKIRKRVGGEAHFFREFARFTSVDNRVYVCHLEPKSNVIMLVANHFADRMPSEHWMIIDDVRRFAVVHPMNQDNYIRYLSDSEFKTLKEIEEMGDRFTDMWKDFFNVIGIKERENYECQRNMFPIWMRKHAVEF